MLNTSTNDGYYRLFYRPSYYHSSCFKDGQVVRKICPEGQLNTVWDFFSGMKGPHQQRHLLPITDYENTTTFKDNGGHLPAFHWMRLGFVESDVATYKMKAERLPFVHFLPPFRMGRADFCVGSGGARRLRRAGLSDLAAVLKPFPPVVWLTFAALSALLNILLWRRRSDAFLRLIYALLSVACARLYKADLEAARIVPPRTPEAFGSVDELSRLVKGGALRFAISKGSVGDLVLRSNFPAMRQALEANPTIVFSNSEKLCEQMAMDSSLVTIGDYCPTTCLHRLDAASNQLPSYLSGLILRKQTPRHILAKGSMLMDFARSASHWYTETKTPVRKKSCRLPRLRQPESEKGLDYAGLVILFGLATSGAVAVAVAERCLTGLY